MNLSITKALRKAQDLKKEEIEILSVSYIPQKIIFHLKDNIDLEEDISKIDELKSLNQNQLEKIKIIGFNGTLHIPKTDIFINSHTLIKKLLKTPSLLQNKPLKHLKDKK